VGKKEKLKSKKTDKLRSIGKQSGEFVESVLAEYIEMAHLDKTHQNRVALSRKAQFT